MTPPVIPTSWTKGEVKRTAPQVPESGTIEERYEEGIGIALYLRAGESAQDEACWAIGRAKKGSEVFLTGYTFDRWPIVEALENAKARGCVVRVVLDRAATLQGRTKDQLSCARKLMAAGIQETLSHGTSLAEHYRDVGRTAFGGRGICHTKAVLADRALVLGSCNWTTSSRGNIETDAVIRVFESELEAVRTQFMLHTNVGEELTVAQLSDARRGRSESPPRSYPMGNSCASSSNGMPVHGPGFPYPWTSKQPKQRWF